MIYGDCAVRTLQDLTGPVLSPDIYNQKDWGGFNDSDLLFFVNKIYAYLFDKHLMFIFFCEFLSSAAMQFCTEES